MKRLAWLLVAVLALALVPAVASAQTSEEKLAAVGLLTEALDGLDCSTAESCAEGVGAVSEAVAGLKSVLPDLDYSGLDSAIADLEAAIEGGDADEISAAAAAVAAAGADVAAQGEAAAGEEGEGGDGTEEPTAVDTGSEVDGGPSAALLVLAAVLGIVALGTLGARMKMEGR